MKISSFSPLPKDTTDRGLKIVEMRKLGMIVALAGANGAGKSRLFESLRWHANSGNNRHKDYLDAKDIVNTFTEKIKIAESNPYNNSAADIQSFKNTINNHLEIIKKYECIETDCPIEQINIINFVPKFLTLTDPSTRPSSQIQGGFSSAQNPGVDGLQDTAPLYIQHLQNEWHEATHQGFVGDPTTIPEITAKYYHLRKIIKELLKTDLNRQSGQVTLFGKQFAYTQLSDGQKILLQLAVALHAQKATAGQILLMDEPENHIHTAALIEIFDIIQNVLPNTQVWIATHSIPLLAHLYAKDPNCIWYVENGNVAFGGKRTEEVLISLLGDSVQRYKLLQFLELPFQLAASNFVTQCLTNPEVAPLRSGDPQINQISSFLWNSNKAKLKLLDIGAGKGRLLSGLAELDKDIANHLDYFAFDTSNENKQDCEYQIISIYGTNEKWFNSDESLFSATDKNTFDVAVLCNVLHEIPPDSWPEFFGSYGLLQRSLSPQGHLLIVEDMRIPVGELPNHRGYFLLDTVHLKTLFSVTAIDIQANKFIIHDARGDGRLKAHLISSELLTRITPESRKLAITELQATAKRKILEARGAIPATFDDGQKYGFWSQQLANCALYLDQA